MWACWGSGAGVRVDTFHDCESENGSFHECEDSLVDLGGQGGAHPPHQSDLSLRDLKMGPILIAISLAVHPSQ